MILDPDLHAIRTGQADYVAARKAIRRWLRTSDARAPAQVYAALKGWTINTLIHRSFGKETEAWFQLMRIAEDSVADRDPKVAERLGALCDLVYDGMQRAAAADDESLLRLNHVGEILEVVRRHNGCVTRQRIKKETGLGEAHLSQRLSALVLRGLLVREPRGKEAAFELTSAGVALADTWREKRLAEKLASASQLPPLPAPPAPRRGLEARRRGYFKGLGLVKDPITASSAEDVRPIAKLRIAEPPSGLNILTRATEENLGLLNPQVRLRDFLRGAPIERREVKEGLQAGFIPPPQAVSKAYEQTPGYQEA